jgi:hypothetical protein
VLDHHEESAERIKANSIDEQVDLTGGGTALVHVVVESTSEAVGVDEDLAAELGSQGT